MAGKPDIYVDADACPVKDEVLRVAERHGLAVRMVSNRWMWLGDRPSLERIVVGDGFNAADDWIAETIGADDIVVTADIPLAARCLAKGAAALGPAGKPFTSQSIGMAVAMRELLGHLRDTGEIRGGGQAFSRKDRSQFLRALEEIIQAIRRRR